MQKTSSAKENKLAYFVSVLALFFLLLGIYGSVRTGLNFVLFDKYPNGGVLSFSNYSQREEDCFYPMTYFDNEGVARESTADEERMAEEQREVCLSGVAKSRELAKINDISISLFYLFLGAGIFVGKRYL